MLSTASCCHWSTAVPKAARTAFKVRQLEWLSIAPRQLFSVLDLLPIKSQPRSAGYGCRVIQRLIEYCASAQISALLDEVLGCCDLASTGLAQCLGTHDAKRHVHVFQPPTAPWRRLPCCALFNTRPCSPKFIRLIQPGPIRVGSVWQSHPSCFPVLGSVPSCRESMETTTTTATEMTACSISHYMRKDGGPQDPRVLMPHGDLPWVHFKISHVTRSCRPNEQGEHCAAFVRHGAGDGPVWQLRSLVLWAETRCTLVLPRVLAEL